MVWEQIALHPTCQSTSPCWESRAWEAPERVSFASFPVSLGCFRERKAISPGWLWREKPGNELPQSCSGCKWQCCHLWMKDDSSCSSKAGVLYCSPKQVWEPTNYADDWQEEGRGGGGIETPVFTFPLLNSSLFIIRASKSSWWKAGCSFVYKLMVG